MQTNRDQHTKKVEAIPTGMSKTPFESITQKFLSSVESKLIKCPTCGNSIDFSMGVKWEGPDSFTCCGCKRLLSMRLIHRAMNDLGIE